jgi:hypothetical protein
MDFEPGIYPNLSNEDYHAAKGISRSGIMKIKRSPLHYYKSYLCPDRIIKEPTIDMQIGNAVHAALLEPDKFYERYCGAPKLNRTRKADKEIWQDFQTQNADKHVFDKKTWDKINDMAYSLACNKDVESLLAGTKKEASLFFTEEYSGVLCKARPDAFHSNYVIDIKTSQDASELGFSRDMHAYGYHIQAAMIQAALMDIETTSIDDFIFVIVEKEPPYAIAIHKMGRKSLEKGGQQFLENVFKYKTCMQSGNWHSYKMTEVELPGYAFY